MHRLTRLVGESQQLLGVGEEFAAAFGQAHALAVAQEQFDAQVLLEWRIRVVTFDCARCNC